MNPLVTIIIPVYNVKHYLEVCIHSIIEQSYHNLEIIVVDDGSTDGSSELCDLLQKQDQRIQVIHQENAGLSGARNTGIQNASGEYVAFVDSDDYIHPDYVLHQLNRLLETNADFVISGFSAVTDGKITSVAVPEENVLLNTHEAMTLFLNQKNYFNTACNKIYKTSLFQDIRFPERKIFEDFATIYRVIDKSKQVATLPESLYFYQFRDNSIMHESFSPKKLQLIQHAEEIVVFISQRYPKLLEQAHYCLLYCCFTTLRRMIYANPRFRKEEKELRMKTLETSKKIGSVPLSLRDRAGLWTLKAGIPCFKLCWELWCLRKR